MRTLLSILVLPFVLASCAPECLPLDCAADAAVFDFNTDAGNPIIDSGQRDSGTPDAGLMPSGDAGVQLLALIKPVDLVVGAGLMKCFSLYAIDKMGLRVVVLADDAMLKITTNSALLEIVSSNECGFGQIGIAGVAAGKGELAFAFGSLNVTAQVSIEPVNFTLSGFPLVLGIGERISMARLRTTPDITDKGQLRFQWLHTTVSPASLANEERLSSALSLVGQVRGIGTWSASYSAPGLLVQTTTNSIQVASGQLVKMSPRVTRSGGTSLPDSARPGTWLKPGDCYVVEGFGEFNDNGSLYAAAVPNAVVTSSNQSIVNADATGRWCAVGEGEVALNVCEGPICFRWDLVVYASTTLSGLTGNIAPGPFNPEPFSSLPPWLSGANVACLPLSVTVQIRGVMTDITNSPGLLFSVMSNGEAVRFAQIKDSLGQPWSQQNKPCFSFYRNNSMNPYLVTIQYGPPLAIQVSQFRINNH
jgi:hypothetical protein